MAKSHRSTAFDPEIPDGLQVRLVHALIKGTCYPDYGKLTAICYTGRRADILAAGILPAELLPMKFQDFAAIHGGRKIWGGKWGWGKWTRWEIFVETIGRSDEPLPCDQRFTMAPHDRASIDSQIDALYHAIRNSQVTSAVTAAKQAGPTLTLIQGGKVETE